MNRVCVMGSWDFFHFSLHFCYFKFDYICLYIEDEEDNAMSHNFWNYTFNSGFKYINVCLKSYCTLSYFSCS